MAAEQPSAARIPAVVRQARLTVLARDIAYVAMGSILSLTAAACVALYPLLLRHWLRVEVFGGIPLLGVVVALIAPSAALVALIVPMTAAQRWRMMVLAGAPVERDRLGSPDLRAWLRRETTWRQLAYHVVVGPLLEAMGLFALAMLAGGVTLCLAFLWIPDRGGTHPLQVSAGLTVLGVVLVVLAPSVLHRVRRWDTRIGAVLLGANSAERQLARVTESRSGLVASADAERRRIERDLHDGAQARLVALAMQLGLLRATRQDLPEDVTAVLANAHEEAVRAIEELRQLVRGFHPAVLDDLGLDAALSALLASMPLPVHLRVRVDERASPSVEAVAYFVVSEAVGNVVKHAMAHTVTVSVDRVDDSLAVVVTDDGIGGANPAHGTGISGLIQRVQSVEGTLTLDSPPGGPTIISVKLPCES